MQNFMYDKRSFNWAFSHVEAPCFVWFVVEVVVGHDWLVLVVFNSSNLVDN